MVDEVRIPIREDVDVVTARRRGRALAEQCGISGSDLTVIATAISEIARNILTYAHEGEVVLTAVERDGTPGISVIASDEGPGIADIELALQDGYSTARSLGLGLPGTRRLMDEFEIVSEPGRGTTVSMKKSAR